MIISGKELGVTSIYSSKTDNLVDNKIEQERRLIKDELKVKYYIFRISLI